jgi:rhodanese-related sulfurtransferase
MLYQTILPSELFSKLEANEKFRFIDVREPIEHEMANIEKAELLPLSTFNDWIDTLKKDEEIVVMCHHGIRSANVCMFLVRNGFKRVFNLDGGIDLWSKQVDGNVPRY